MVVDGGGVSKEGTRTLNFEPYGKLPPLLDSPRPDKIDVENVFVPQQKSQRDGPE